MSGTQIQELNLQQEEKQETSNEQKQVKKLPGTAWLTFYTYFRLPLSLVMIIFGLANVLIRQRYMQLPLLIALTIFLAMVFWGLHKRYLWGWHFNWVLIIIDIMAVSYGYTIYNEYFIKLLDFTIIWGMPNLIYFQKRRRLFE